MKLSQNRYFLVLFCALLLITQVHAQKAGLKKIDLPDLDSHLTFLIDDDLEGRATGEPGLDKAAEYIRKQAKRIGLKAIDDNGDYYQEYTLVSKRMDTENSSITVISEKEKINLGNPFYLLNPDTLNHEISGEVVFAGYGIYSKEDEYNDFDGIEIGGKIVMIMNRGPLDESGKSLLEGQDWSSDRSYQFKMPGIIMRGPKAVLIVMDPKSGYNSLEEYSPRMARYLSTSRYVKEFGQKDRSFMPNVATKIIMIHREVADEILKGGSKTLEKLQNKIDKKLKPVSFDIPETTVEISANYTLDEKAVPNVVGLIEGNDPELKKEVIIYTAHFDHVGTDGMGGVFNGADDNASGTVALMEIGEAFMAEQKNLKRSVMILWVSGEEIGLFGSKYYTENPLIPLEQTVVNMNLDMVGSVRTERDKGSVGGEKVSVLGMDSLSLIGGHQSSELMDIHNQTMDKVGMFTDSTMNDPNHPYRYFYRSDHINFARRNIPILFYSTGIHVDYHKITDNYDRINFEKLKKVSELSYLVGYELATRPERIVVDNPFSNWGRMR
ncbi:MAG TPA: M28 family peptidase [Bacteroides sp.]|nr:M28 family peptidase [Bacteroides sp.]